MDHIDEQINCHLPEFFVYKERLVTTELIMIDNEVDFPDLFNLLPWTPDLLLVDHDSKTVYMVEISCPWD